MATRTKVTVESRAFQKALATATKLISRKNALPILGDVLLQFKKDKGFTLTSSNTEGWLTLPLEQMKLIEHHVDGKLQVPAEYSVCLPAVQLQQAISALPDAVLQMWIDTEKKQMQVEYLAGEQTTGKFSMPIDLSDEYPLAPVVSQPECQFTTPTATLLPMIRAARVAVATNELRPQMQCVCIDVDNEGYSVVASDGYQLVANSVHIGLGTGFLTGQPRQVLLHSSVIEPLLLAFQGAENVTVSATSQQVGITSDGLSLVFRAVEIKYPNWRSFIPKESAYTATVDKDSLVRTLKRVQLFANESSNMVRISCEGGKVRLQADDIDFARAAEEQLALQDTNLPDGFLIGVKGSTLLSILSTVKTESVILHLTDPSRVIVLREEATDSLYTGLCMPMSLNG